MTGAFPGAAQRAGRAALAAAACAIAAGAARAADPGELLYVAEGNRLHRIDVDTVDAPPLLREVLIERASGDPERGRDINGMVCALPDGSGRFVAGEDTGQPHPPAGWGVFEADGRQVGKLSATSRAGVPDPYGCAFDAEGRLFSSDVGDPGFGTPNGQLLLWFPPFDHFPGPPGAYPASDAPSTRFCAIASDIGTAGALAVDRSGRVYLASSSRLAIYRFSPPSPAWPSRRAGTSTPRASPRAASTSTIRAAVACARSSSRPSGCRRSRRATPRVWASTPAGPSTTPISTWSGAAGCPVPARTGRCGASASTRRASPSRPRS